MRIPNLTAAQEQQVGSLIRHIDAAIDETIADQGEELAYSRDEMYPDMVTAILTCEMDPFDRDVANEVCRRTLGWVPAALTSYLGSTDWLDS